MNEAETAVVPLRNQSMLRINILCIIGGLGLLILSIYPGFVSRWFIILALPLIGALGLAWCIILIRAASGKRPPIPPLEILFAPIVVCLTFALLRYYIPRRIVFRAHQSAFERSLASAPAPGKLAPLNKWLGLYHVDSIAADPRGGIYFRTSTSADMIDTYSYVFASSPNDEGSTFGNAYYVIRPITRDWYWFQTNNDW